MVRDGVVVRAKSLPAGERRAVLMPIADRLEKAGREIDRLARQVPVATARPLWQIAAAARAGDTQLRALLQEATP